MADDKYIKNNNREHVVSIEDDNDEHSMKGLINSINKLSTNLDLFHKTMMDVLILNPISNLETSLEFISDAILELKSDLATK